MSSDKSSELAQLHKDLNHQWLNPWWAKFEIVLGLVGMVFSFVAGIEIAIERITHPEHAYQWAMWVGPVVIFVLGAYLTLAGHRSHLYQSNNRLAAYLAGLIRANPPGPRS